MKKIFISGKITGDCAYANKFLSAELEASKLGYDTINPVTICKNEWSWQRCMRSCINVLLYCDAIYLIKDWADSKGSRIEKMIAEEMEMEIIYQK